MGTGACVTHLASILEPPPFLLTRLLVHKPPTLYNTAMIELTGKQKRQLRSLGQTLDAALMIGKAGLTPQIIEQVQQLLLERELIKLRLTGPAGDVRKLMAAELEESTDATCAGIVGKTILLYKPNPKLDQNKRIDLS